MRYTFWFRSMFMLSICLVGTVNCGGNGADAKSPADVQPATTPMQDLRGVVKDLDESVAAVMQPIDDTQRVIDDVLGLPKRCGITVTDAMGKAKATVSDDKVEVTASADVDASVQAEIAASMKRLHDLVVELKATPDKVVTLGKKVAQATVTIPTLVTRIKAMASLDSANIFAKPEVRASGSSDLKEVGELEAVAKHRVAEVQRQIGAIPEMAAKALGKLAMAFVV